MGVFTRRPCDALCSARTTRTPGTTRTRNPVSQVLASLTSLLSLSSLVRIQSETSLPRREHRARIMAAEAEGVVEGDAHGPVDGGVGGDVDVAGRILLSEVDGGRHHAGDDAEDGGDGLD